jgi:hypothetical protein
MNFFIKSAPYSLANFSALYGTFLATPARISSVQVNPVIFFPSIKRLLFESFTFNRPQ